MIHTVLTVNPLDFGCSGVNGKRVQEEIGFGKSAGDAGYQIFLCLTVGLRMAKSLKNSSAEAEVVWAERRKDQKSDDILLK
mmetsp:Transcript_26685/g.27044  ORF Transcript_26685/g.27044 Transcript_26685/m.27044 type:complete len:81 (+) Transcript_26685:703-945(+)